MIATLAEIVAADGDRVGGKALNCAQLRRAGFPVPDGLVVVATLAGLDNRRHDPSRDPSREPSNDDEFGIAPADVARLIAHPWFAAFADDQRFAVRSSAVGEDSAGHSFAGVHDTVLDVERSQILAAVRTCVRSTQSEQARVYRASRGLAATARTGVLIQPMVAARVSGVVFTVNPVTGADELVVETVAGLGDDLVSGRIQPDRYRLAKADGAVLERDGPGLAGEELAVLPVLVDLARRVERFYHAPQDIEWAADAKGVWLLQSRPITTAAALPAAALDLPSAVPADVEWTRANLAEVMPDQTSPQSLASYVALLNAAQRMFAGRLLAEDEYGPPFAAIGGRMYFNLTQVIKISQIAGIPPAAAKRSIGHSEGITPEDEVRAPVPIGRFLRSLPDFFRLAWLDLRSAALVRRMDADNVIATARLAVADPGSLDDAAILERLSEWAANGPRQMLVVLVHTGVVRIEEQLRKICRAVGEDYEAFVYPQLAVGEPSVSTQQAFDLVELAETARSESQVSSALATRSAGDGNYREPLAGTRFLAAFDRFLERYGHRGLYESDSALPRYREDPSPLLFAIQTHLNNPPAESPSAIRQRLQEQAAAAWARFDARLSWVQRLTTKPRVKALVAGIKSRYRRREYCRSELVKVLESARRLQLVLAARFVQRGWIDSTDDYFMLLPSEIDARVGGALEPAALRPIVAGRRQRLAFERTLAMPLYLRQADIPAVLSGLSPGTPPTPLEDEDRLTGLCVSRGTVEAPVVVIRDPREFALMQRGAILVAPATDPSWTPLFTLAAGVIVEVGGVLSHASTVAREYGLPALANVNRATTRLRTGDRVRLDASAGVAVRYRDGHPRDPR